MRIHLSLDSPRLEASARIIKGLLLPFGEVGYPHGASSLIASPKTLIGPLDPSLVELNLEHDESLRVGRALWIKETDEGIAAAFEIDPGPQGDRALDLVKQKRLTGLSIEIDGPAISGQKLTAGIITGAALVETPAFSTARIAANRKGDTKVNLTAEELNLIKTAILEELKTTPDEETETETAEDLTEAVEEAVEEIVEEEEASNPAVAAARRAARRRHGNPGGGRKSLTAKDLYRALARAAHGPAAVRAALSDVVPANTLGIHQPAYVGELWSGKAYERKIIPAFNHQDLTSMKIQGWRWKVRPEVGQWDGNKTAVPSSPVETEPVNLEPKRIAGGHDIDRIYKDFGEEEFWEAYYKAMTESYARLSDAMALAALLDAAHQVSPGPGPSGVAPGMVYIVDGAMSILAETNTPPSHAFMAPDLYRDLVLTRADDSLAYLSAALGMEDGTLDNFRIVPDSSLTPGSVLVSCKDAATIHELGGDAPIRVEALDVGRGGIDAAVFGYQAVNVHDSGGLALVQESA